MSTRNFAVIVVEVTELDWLWLGPQDLRRARLQWTGGELGRPISFSMTGW